MRVFNTPFNSPLNNTGDPRTETRTRQELSTGNVRDVHRGGGRPFDCRKDKDAASRLQGWFNTMNKNFYRGAFRHNPNLKWQEVMRQDGTKFTDYRKGVTKNYQLSGLVQQEGWTDEKYKKSANLNIKRFQQQMQFGNTCKAYEFYQKIKMNFRKGRPEDYYYSKIYQYQGDEDTLNKFKKRNQNLLTTITEQRQITDSMKENLPGYLKQWEDNVDGIRSKYKTYEDYVVASEKWKKDNPDWNKEKGGSTTPWVETSRKTEKVNRT